MVSERSTDLQTGKWDFPKGLKLPDTLPVPGQG